MALRKTKMPMWLYWWQQCWLSKNPIWIFFIATLRGINSKQKKLKLYLWWILRAISEGLQVSIEITCKKQEVWALEPLKHHLKKNWLFLPCFPCLHPGSSLQSEMLTSTAFIKNNKTHVIHLIKEEKIQWNYMKKHYL